MRVCNFDRPTGAASRTGRSCSRRSPVGDTDGLRGRRASAAVHLAQRLHAAGALCRTSRHQRHHRRDTWRMEIYLDADAVGGRPLGLDRVPRRRQQRLRLKPDNDTAHRGQ